MKTDAPLSDLGGSTRNPMDAMNRTFLVRSALAGLSCMALACSTTSSTPEPTPSHDGIHAVLTEMADAWNRDDLAGHVAPYADSATYTLGTGLITGRDTIAAVTGRAWSRGGDLAGTLSFSDVRIEPLGSAHALVTGAFLVADYDGEQDARGRFTLVMQHTPRGWVVLHDHSS